MKKGKKFLVLLILTVMATMFTSCTKNEYWESDNQIRIFRNLKVIDETEPEPEYGKSEYQFTKSEMSKMKELDKEAIKFFQEKHNIDVSIKISQNDVKVFHLDIDEDFIAGYTDTQIHLNELLFIDNNFKMLFESSYIHELMHYVGFKSADVNCIDEGMAEHFSVEFAEYTGINYIATEDYFLYKQVADQMCIVNEEEICRKYIETDNFQICEHISEKVAFVEQPFFKNDNPGKLLSTLLPVIEPVIEEYDINETYSFAVIAQEIINAYCKEVKQPNKKEIEEMRELYIVPDIEEIEIEKEGDIFYVN